MNSDIHVYAEPFGDEMEIESSDPEQRMLRSNPERRNVLLDTDLERARVYRAAATSRSRSEQPRGERIFKNKNSVDRIPMLPTDARSARCRQSPFPCSETRM